MISISWSPLCHCLSEAVARDIDFKCLYELHAKSTTNCRYCSWFLQAQQVQKTHVDQDSQALSDDIAQTVKKSVENVQKQLQRIEHKWQIEQARMLEQQQEQEQIEQERIEEARLEKKRQEVEEQARIEKIKAEVFVCRRCSVKFSSNIKLHEHIRDHHAKKSKSAVSSSTPSKSIVVLSSTSSSTPPESIIFLSASPKSASQPKALSTSSSTSSTSSQSIISSISSKSSFLSGFASEFVFKRSESAPLTSSHTLVAMRSTFPSKSTFDIFTKLYLTIIDLYIMFAGKFMRAKLFSSQNSPFSSGVSVSRQARIIFYFLSIVKSTKFKLFTSVHGSIKQSTRVSSSRSSFSSFRSSSSIRFLFSTSFYFSSVCWRCQESFATCLSRNWAGSIAARAEISVRRRERRLFL